MKNEDNWVSEVMQLRGRGLFLETVEKLTKIISCNPTDALAYYHLAWTHDALGKETDAAPAYEKAIALGLEGDDLEGAYLGLGSTYRCLGKYDSSRKVLMAGIEKFPENRAMKIFFAMTQYNLQNHSAAMELLITQLVESANDQSIKMYEKAIRFYADKLDKKFD